MILSEAQTISFGRTFKVREMINSMAGFETAMWIHLMRLMKCGRKKLFLQLILEPNP